MSQMNEVDARFSPLPAIVCPRLSRCLLSDPRSSCVSRLRWKNEIPTRTHRQEEEFCAQSEFRDTTCTTLTHLYSRYFHGRMQLINTRTDTHTQPVARTLGAAVLTLACTPIAGACRKNTCGRKRELCSYQVHRNTNQTKVSLRLLTGTSSRSCQVVLEVV